LKQKLILYKCYTNIFIKFDTCHITLSLPRGTMTAWHVVIFWIFLKKFKIKKKIQKTYNKKIQKIEELICDTPFNDVNLDLTERANVRRFNKNMDQLETFKNLSIILRFW